MELSFGNHVRSGGRRIGYLAGVEIDVPGRRVTKIIFSNDGKLGSQAQTRPIEGARVERGGISVADTVAAAASPTETFLLSRSVRVNRGGHQAGHVVGLTVSDLGALETIIGRQHWWSGRFRVAASDLELSQPGEVRTGVATRAA